MRVLVACEFSNTVRDAFLRRGHDAYSCDLQRAVYPNPNFRRHIRGDVRPLLREKWDLVIAHPPCIYLSKIGACRFVSNMPFEEQPRASGVIEGAKFFIECLEANSRHICVENPTQHRYAKGLIGVDYTQTIEPWQFGHPYTKETHLWLTNLPLLQPTQIVEPVESWVGGKNGKGVVRDPNLRAKTFQGIADAMAKQWG